MKRLVVPLLAIGLAVLLADGYAQPKDAKNPDGERSHFKHVDHQGYGVETTKCQTCHSIDAKGNVLAPAAQGHAPCLQSGCHAETFLTISEANQKNPAMAEKWKKATGFCLACHEQVPWAWKKPTTRILEGWQDEREFHIEMAKTAQSAMDHYGHTQAKLNGAQVGCRDCHAVDPKTFEFVKGSPGHAQCVRCHNAADKVAFAMVDCARCHKPGSRDEFLRKVLEDSGKKLKEKDVPTRPDADVRACKSQGAKQYADKKGKVPCFKHETKEHREDKTGNGVQCSKCHYIVTNKGAWSNGRTFNSIADLQLNKIIGDKPNDTRSMQHGACAGCHPHDAQVQLSGGACQYCHTERTTKEPYW